MKIRIRHEYRNIPYEVELESEALEDIEMLHSILDKIHKLIDELAAAHEERGGHAIA